LAQRCDFDEKGEVGGQERTDKPYLWRDERFFCEEVVISESSAPNPSFKDRGKEPTYGVNDDIPKHHK
jgi:hypothetical protein